MKLRRLIPLSIFALSACGPGFQADEIWVTPPLTLAFDFSQGEITGGTKVIGNQCFAATVSTDSMVRKATSVTITSSRSHTLFYANRCPSYDLLGNFTNDTSFGGTSGIPVAIPEGAKSATFYVQIGNTSDAEEDTLLTATAPDMSKAQQDLRVIRAKTQVVAGGECLPSRMELRNAADNSAISLKALTLYLQVRNPQAFTGIFASQANCNTASAYFASLGASGLPGINGLYAGSVLLSISYGAVLSPGVSQIPFFYRKDVTDYPGAQTLAASERYFQTIASHSLGI